MRNVVMSMSARLYADISQKPNARTSAFFWLMTVTMARSSLGVLWRTSYFHTVGQWSRIKRDAMFRRVRQVAVLFVRRTTTVFVRMQRRGKICYLRLYCCII